MQQELSSAAAPSSLAEALEQNEAVQETVEQSAAELCVINAVLKQEVPAYAQTGEVLQALRKTDDLESRIQASAEELQHVNQVLKEEIHARADLERRLATAQAELDRAQSFGQRHSTGSSASQ